jgi:multidrug transporter EmrE-like cation transporter
MKSEIATAIATGITAGLIPVTLKSAISGAGYFYEWNRYTLWHLVTSSPMFWVTILLLVLTGIFTFISLRLGKSGIVFPIMVGVGFIATELGSVLFLGEYMILQNIIALISIVIILIGVVIVSKSK